MNIFKIFFGKNRQKMKAVVPYSLRLFGDFNKKYEEYVHKNKNLNLKWEVV
ncbi:MAG: hypothetical protein KGQ36_07690 [Rickettsiales bacterium]|nr:hypothetical protein [Rickettsiales bacterium]